jgi:hypothetical protein
MFWRSAFFRTTSWKANAGGAFGALLEMAGIASDPVISGSFAAAAGGLIDTGGVAFAGDCRRLTKFLDMTLDVQLAIFLDTDDDDECCGCFTDFVCIQSLVDGGGF